MIAYLAKSSVNPMFAAEVLGERNRQQYISQSAATVAGRAAPFPSHSQPHTAEFPATVAGGNSYAYDETLDGREPSTDTHWEF